MSIRSKVSEHHPKWTKVVIPTATIMAMAVTACTWPMMDAPMEVVAAGLLVWIGVAHRNSGG